MTAASPFTTRRGDPVTWQRVRAEMLRALRRFGPLFTSEQRVRAVDAILADEAWLRHRHGMIVGAVARDAESRAITIIHGESE